MKKNLKKLMNVIFAIKNTPMKTLKFEITAILLVNKEAQPIKNAI